VFGHMPTFISAIQRPRGMRKLTRTPRRFARYRYGNSDSTYQLLVIKKG
jgi:hypothetical protein